MRRARRGRVRLSLTWTRMEEIRGLKKHETGDWPVDRRYGRGGVSGQGREDERKRCERERRFAMFCQESEST